MTMIITNVEKGINLKITIIKSFIKKKLKSKQIFTRITTETEPQ